MNSNDPVTLDQLVKLRQFEQIGKKYLAPGESYTQEKDYHVEERSTFKYYLQHPCTRLVTIFTLVVLDIYLIAENPISYSESGCRIDVIGNIYTFIFLKYPENGFAALKVIFWVLALLLGLVTGKLVIHRRILCLKLKSRFFAIDSQGAWIIMLLTSIVSLYAFSLLYNVVLDAEGGHVALFKCDNGFRVDNKSLMKAFAAFIWIGNMITMWIIIDTMLQEKEYPKILTGTRAIWRKGNQRLVFFWLLTVGFATLITIAIATDFITWDQMHSHFPATDEFSRACLASVVLFLEILILIQDWDFPHFANNGAAKLPGLNVNYLRGSVPCCPKCGIVISGKWFSYGTLVLVITLQFILWTRQMHYAPNEFGQSADSGGRIYSVLSKESAKGPDFRGDLNEVKWNNSADGYNRTLLANSKARPISVMYRGYSMRLKALSSVPWLLAVCFFFYLAHQYGKQESSDERIVRNWKEGRLKRRKRRIVPALDIKAATISTVAIEVEKREASKNTICGTISAPARKGNSEHTSFDHYFRHPNIRLFIAYFLVFLTWLMFAQDPIAYSAADCRVNVFGHAYSFVILRYPGGGYSAMKVLFWLGAVISGMILGKAFVHKVLLCRTFRFKIFTSDGEGSWVIMFLTTVVSLFSWTFLYNETISISGYPQYAVSSNMEMEYKTFMKGASSASWLAHFLTAWMVTDNMLQQKRYPLWAKDLRYFWRRGILRIVIFWVIAVLTTSLTILAICFDLLSWDTMNRGLPSSNEVSRSFLASFIIAFDFLVIMQDWQFPNFNNNSKIKLPGMKRNNLNFRIFSVDVKIKGKWLCYGLVAMVLIIDVWTWSNQLFYTPAKYGQYVTKTRQVYSVTDAHFIRNANETMISFDYRSTGHLIADDFDTNTQYFGDNLAKKSAAFIPGLATFIWFIVAAIKGKAPEGAQTK